MKSFSVVFCVAAWSVLTAWAFEVEGVVQLSSGDTPWGARVIFTAASPNAETDTAVAGIRGIFETNLSPGWYDVNYWRPGFAVYELGLLEVRTPLNLPLVVLMPPIHGMLNGVVGPGDFQVTDSLYVPDGQTATLLPGTRLYFARNLPFRVEGRLIAAGTPEDSVVLSRRYPTGFEATWHGLTLLNADDGTRLEYVVVEHATKTNYLRGGGIYCSGPPIQISHSTIRYNHADLGAGMFIEHCTALVESCAFVENISNGGAGLTLSQARVSVKGCTFQGNDAYYSGGGLYAENHDSSTVEGCQFIGNSAFDGAGIAILAVPTQIRECVFTENYSSRAAALLCNNADGALISRCTMTRSTGPLASAFSSISVYGGSTTISSTIVAESNVQFGVMLSIAQDLSFHHSDIFISGGEPFGFSGSDSSQGPIGLGVPDTFNSRGDTCDAYENIFLDPEFVSPDSSDYHLNFWSPCIDTGDPNLSPDPDGTVADIGAFYHSQLSAETPPLAPQTFALLQNYPNPFNSRTQIRFELPRAGQVELAVFDVTGRQAAKLLSGPLSGGPHELSFDARNLAGGIYFYRLSSGDFSQTRKMVLLK
jgi:hypothetical protein